MPPPVRMITLQREGKRICLGTTLQKRPHTVVLYRCRWEIEAFFKWLKCILGACGFLAEIRNGVSAQLYTALIIALLLAAVTGTCPNKCLIEALGLYLAG